MAKEDETNVDASGLFEDVKQPINIDSVAEVEAELEALRSEVKRLRGLTEKPSSVEAIQQQHRQAMVDNRAEAIERVDKFIKHHRDFRNSEEYVYRVEWRIHRQSTNADGTLKEIWTEANFTSNVKIEGGDPARLAESIGALWWEKREFKGLELTGEDRTDFKRCAFRNGKLLGRNPRFGKGAAKKKFVIQTPSDQKLAENFEHYQKTGDFGHDEKSNRSAKTELEFEPITTG